MSLASAVALGDQFARELPEIALAWPAEPAPEPQLLVLNEPLAESLGLDPSPLRGDLGLLTGTVVPAGATPVAQGYAGHQFGNYSPRLGDGRALLLGELVDRFGRVRDLHLKGSGRTPFARGGDGLAAVGPMLREYVVSEAMHALDIPTTRSLSVVATGRTITRETPQPGAVLARVAASHLRVGSFQYVAASGDVELLRRLADHAIDRHYPSVRDAANPYLELLRRVVEVQASLVARWMLVGFVHGMMNTDNMTISGETIDYGPCAFMDAYDPAASYSSIDELGRYAYENQPAAALWNLARLAEALLPLIHADQARAVSLATSVIETFTPHYEASRSAGYAAKLGVAEPDDVLVADLLRLLEADHVDYTSFFRDLGGAARGDAEPARARFLDLTGIDEWTQRWLALAPDADAMDRVNPAYIPRNHLVEDALGAATAGDLSPLYALLDAVCDPFVARPGLERYAEGAPEDFGRYRTFCGT